MFPSSVPAGVRPSCPTGWKAPSARSGTGLTCGRRSACGCLARTGGAAGLEPRPPSPCLGGPCELGQSLVRCCRAAELGPVLQRRAGSRAPRASHVTAASVSLSSQRVRTDTVLEAGTRIKCLAECLAHSRCFILMSFCCNVSAETPENYSALWGASIGNHLFCAVV